MIAGFYFMFGGCDSFSSIPSSNKRGFFASSTNVKAIPRLQTSSMEQPCGGVYGNPLLNIPLVQSVMHNMYINGHGPDYNPLPQNQRHEIMVAIDMNQYGVYTKRILTTYNATACSWYGDIQVYSIPSQTTTVALFDLHTEANGYWFSYQRNPGCYEARGLNHSYDYPALNDQLAAQDYNVSLYYNVQIFQIAPSYIRRIDPAVPLHYANVYPRDDCYQ